MKTAQSKIKTKLSDELQRTAAKEQLDADMLVEAGAGTGKTSTLIERLFNIISKGRSDIDRIVAITFTEKAAAEMVERLRLRLTRFTADESVDPVLKKNATRALEDFERHRISTIHSFCMSILKECPYSAGIDPAFEIIDPQKEEDALDELWEDWIADELEDYEGVIRFGYLAGMTNYIYRALFDFLYQNRANIKEIEENISPVPVDCILRSTKESQQEIGVALNDLVTLADDYCTDKTDKGYLKILEYKDYYNRMTSKDDAAKLADLINWKMKGQSGGRKDNWKIPKPEKTKACNDFTEFVYSKKEQICRMLLDGFISRLTGLVSRMEEYKRDNGVLNHDDLLIKTRNLLKNDRRVREHYKGRFAKILVDEFQDTDPLQAEIVFTLCRDDDRLQTQDFNDTGGKLFLVGDPKQSIYGFRRADIEIYEKTKEKLQKGGNGRQGTISKITVNFRCAPGVIKWVNEEFDPHFRKPADGLYQPEYEALKGFRVENVPDPVVVLKPEESLREEFNKGKNVIAAEAEAVAAYIKEMVMSGGVEIVPKNGPRRLMEYRDVALLFPKYRYMPYFEDALAERSVPFVIEGGRLFHHREEIRDVISTLKAIDDPKDQLALAACLKSPMFSVSDEELLEFALSGTPLSYTGDEPRYEKISHANRALPAFDILMRFHHCRNETPVGELLKQLYDATGIKLFYIGAHKDQRSAANLDKLLKLARRFEFNELGTLRRFIRNLETAKKNQEQESDASLSEAGSNAVSLMTFHKSKGLEFPVVVLTAMNADPKGSGTHFYLDKQTKQVEGSYSGFKTPNLEDVKERKKEEQNAETVRLLYVASTRARDVLVVPAYYKIKTEKKKQEPQLSSYQEVLKRTMTGTEDVKSLTRTEVFDEQRTEKLKEKPEIIKFDDRKKPESDYFTGRMETWKKNRRKAIDNAAVGRKRTASYTSGKKEDMEDVDEQNPAARRIGIAYHKVLEEVDFKTGLTGDYLIEKAAAEEAAPEHTKTIKQLVEKTLASEPVKRALKAKWYDREYPFDNVIIDGNRTTGVIDLLIEESDGFVIVDFKSDDVYEEKVEEKMESYRDQWEMYKKAVGTELRTPVKEIIYYFPRPDRAISIRP